MQSKTYQIQVTLNYDLIIREPSEYEYVRAVKELAGELQELLDNNTYIYDFLKYQIPGVNLFNIVLSVGNNE